LANARLHAAYVYYMGGEWERAVEFCDKALAMKVYPFPFSPLQHFSLCLSDKSLSLLSH